GLEGRPGSDDEEAPARGGAGERTVDRVARHDTSRERSLLEEVFAADGRVEPPRERERRRERAAALLPQGLAVPRVERGDAARGGDEDAPLVRRRRELERREARGEAAVRRAVPVREREERAVPAEEEDRARSDGRARRSA